MATDWLGALESLRERRLDAVLVTVVGARGHAPREAGAKMVVSLDDVAGTIGGGNVEATALARARAILDDATDTPTTETVNLSDKAPAEYGVQCCGGEVTVLYEPIRRRPAVTVFGVGHVGIELARILARHPIELHLIDSRPSMLDAARLAPLDDGRATLRVHNAPVPEAALDDVPSDTHVLIMTHDHAEDLAIADACLHRSGLASIGLIGSNAKWARFKKRLGEAGHTPESIATITTPIGRRDIAAKDPAAIAVGVAGDLLASVYSNSLTGKQPSTQSQESREP